MRASNARRVIAVVIVALMSGCAANPTPELWRPSAVQAQRATRGGWVVVEPPSSGVPSDVAPVAGELIAIDDTSIYVLTAGGLRSVARSSPHRLTVVAYSTPSGSLTAWVIAGGVSTLSHGYYLPFTAPMWAVVGIWAVLSERGAARVHDEDRARPFARFPQGLPTGFDPQALGPLMSKPTAAVPVPRR